MSNNDDFQIGVAAHNKTGSFTGGKFFDIEANKNNVYRVLPPLFSLAQEGKYAKWYATHKSFPGTNGKRRKFQCVEDIDKTGRVLRHCPMCIKAKEAEAQLELLKNKGGSKEQLWDFRIKHVYPIMSERRYYLNVINQANEIGILAVNSKMFKALRALADENDKKGIDITGMEGYFLNFTKKSEYKGDNQALFNVTMYMEEAPDGDSMRKVKHSLTKELIAKIKTDARDLTTLFRSISVEDMELMVNAEESQRAALVDRIFASPTKTHAPDPLTREVTGTSATLVGRVELTESGVSIAMPDAVPAAVAQPVAAPVAPVAAAPKAATKADLPSDEEFMRQMEALVGKATSR